MQSKRQTRIAAMREIAEREGWQSIDSDEWHLLCAQFPNVSEKTLRHDLREIIFPVHPLIEGVRLDSLEDLERSLRALACLYQEAVSRNPRDTMNAARRLVLEARRKAENVLRNPRVDAEKRAAMEEKFLWLRTWLENPPVFDSWASIRSKIHGNP